MYAILYFAAPKGTAPQLGFASVTLNKENVSSLNAQAGQLGIWHVNVLDFAQVQFTALDIRHAQVRPGMLAGPICGAFLNAVGHRRHFAKRHRAEPSA